MSTIEPEVVSTFGNKLRIRVCGICIQNEQILLVNHKGLGKTNNFWAPPGGGIQFGETAVETLHREFAEETGLEIRVGKFLFINEFIGKPLHAIEFFFEVHVAGGNLIQGLDPELTQQIIQEVKFVSFADIQEYQKQEVHSLFHHCNSLTDVLRLSGYLNLNNHL